MKKKTLLIFILLVLLVSCSPTEIDSDVENYFEQSKINQSEFSLSPREEIPSMDNEGYWYFGVWINNNTSSTITIDMKTGMKIYYKVNDNWIQTTNHNLRYEHIWKIPPNSIETPPWTLVFIPNVKYEDITFRVFLIGQTDDSDQNQVVGAMEYVIKNNNLEEINSISVSDNEGEMDTLYSSAISSRSQLTLSQSVDFTPIKDEENYWLFKIRINNFTNSDILTGPNMGLRIFYQDNNLWFETTNHEISYPDKNTIPPNATTVNPTITYVRPNIQRENLVIRVFLLGSVENFDENQVVGMIEYVIKNDQFYDTNTIE